MHIPDGFLSTPVWLSLAAVSAVSVGALAPKAQRETEEARLPLLGVMGAFVFAAQMINFPLGMGTSGHLVGGTLLASTLGPAAAALVMSAILGIQALVFQDGGVLALGANVFNMALAGVFAGYLPLALWGDRRYRSAAVACGGLLSVCVSGALALAELIISGVRVPTALLWLSVLLFLINGLAEAVITVAVVRALARLNVAWVRGPALGARRAPAALGAAAVVLSMAGVMVASQYPDVLESFADRAGLAARAKALFETPFADYQASWFGESWWAKVVAGLLGVALIYALLVGVTRMAGRRRSK